MNLPALPFIIPRVTAGLSASRAYREYQAVAHDAGMRGMRRQDFLRLYSQTINLREREREALEAPKNVPLGGLTPSDRNSVRAQGIAHHVRVFQRERGGSDLIIKRFLIKSDQPLTPEEAENQALAWLERGRDTYNRKVLGVAYVGAERLNPQPF